jgi:hypothetical protein
MIFLSSCASFYEQNLAYNNQVQQGNYTQAKDLLSKSKYMNMTKNNILLLLNRGYLDYMLGNYDTAINDFNNADIIIEDQRKKFGSEVLSFVSNPGVKPYKTEDFENVMVNFYKALSFINKNNYEGATVECRRINEKLYSLNDKYKSKRANNRYSDDAFAHYLMGLVYEAQNDHNNAFIAYRNAYKIYDEIYTKKFETPAPTQLKYDILRSARNTGLANEVEFFKKKFEFNDSIKIADKNEGGELIFFWFNGFCPRKHEWSLNFATSANGAGMMTFYDENEDVSIPFNTNTLSSNERSSLKNVSAVRVAFPKYIERRPVYQKAKIITEETKDIKLEKVEDINKIAFTCLKDRMLREMGNSLLRLAVKQGLEAYARSKDENLGALVSILNAVTEKADTRNWQTLPHSISFARIPLKKGQNTIKLKITDSTGSSEIKEFTFEGKGNTEFFTYSSLESYN